jgi:glycine/D-amino acid oxidase-like deaminating enzyme
MSLVQPTGLAGGSYWFSSGDPGPARAAYAGTSRVDVAIVGGGFTGLWTAISLLTADPSLRVVVLEADRVGSGASGRNGGFCAASLTHGLSNGLLHFPDEIDELERQGVENLAGLVAFVRSEGIDCELEETGTLDVATQPHEVEGLQAYAEVAARHGHSLSFLDRREIQAEVRSPRFLAGVRAGPESCVMVNPAKLAWGLASAVERRGGVIFEGSRVTGLARRASGVTVRVAGDATVQASQVIVATSAYSGWLRRLVPLFVPVYDYVLVTVPLSGAQRESIGWRGREGMGDAGYQFHYFRLTADDRILWGGYDAIYHPGNRVVPEHDQREATFEKLAAHFRETFPQLGDLPFTHRWGGAIDTTTRFHVTFGEALGGRVHYALGYTGLGVGAARWAAGVLRDKLLEPASPRLGMRFIRSRPFPIPPEPARTPAVELMRRAVISADEHGGEAGLFLRAMEALGVGFDS